MTTLSFEPRHESIYPSAVSTGAPATVHWPELHLQALPALEWSRAIELSGRVAGSPAGVRRAWIHRAPEEQVVELYRSAAAQTSRLAAPWWLRALAAGALASRTGGFAVEDAVAALLSARDGWIYVPWVGSGEDGYWEYVPSERAALPGSVPTTVVFTHRHRGWIDVVPAHAERTPDPIEIAGAAALAARLPELETL